jgi:hypothetical protein
MVLLEVVEVCFRDGFRASRANEPSMSRNSSVTLPFGCAATQ